jgi:membrane-associated phospholipid phosphatase
MRMRVPVLMALWSLPVLSATAQDTTAHGDTLIPDRRLFQRSDAYVMAAFGAATVGMLSVDRELRSTFRAERLIESRTLNRIEHTLDFLGGPAPYLIGASMYMVGRFGRLPRAAHLAVHTTEAILVGHGTAGLLKGLLGRARPFVSADSSPRDFALGRGFRSAQHQSFPSGHTTAGFAVAAAVTSETSEWWPRSRWIIGPVLFGGATLVGMARMYDDKHWASDVVMGAAIGTFAGLKTVRFNHTRTGNRIDRWLLGEAALQPQVTPGPDGALRLGVSGRW